MSPLEEKLEDGTDMPQSATPSEVPTGAGRFLTAKARGTKADGSELPVHDERSEWCTLGIVLHGADELVRGLLPLEGPGIVSFVRPRFHDLAKSS